MYLAMPSPTTRKRPAPGASPLPATPIQQAPQQFAPQDYNMRWNGVAANGNSFADVSNPYLLAQQPAPHGQALQSPSPSPSNVLALREPSASRALIPTAPRNTYDEQSDQWGASANDGALVPAPNGTTVPAISEEEHLRLLVARARKIEEEATKENPGPNQKRSIPPFVLKLASFLNNGKNSDLIRWSEKGDSFIVLDEDEFAKKLIPEMFKHNNYASFVRQLNMYGFHKKVGLSDNSMRASEKKNKSPSEYWNPYFLRDYPVLQWLIQKPNKSGGKRKGKQAVKDASGVIEPDSDGEDFIDDTATGTYAVTDIHPGRDIGRGEAGPLAKTEIGKFRDQLAQVQQKQQQVLNMIQQLRRSQDEIVQRAQMFEQMHHRHENSITAILNFLANVFRKSLENDGGAQNLSEMLASILPQHGQNQTIPTGVVQDLGDLFQRQDAARDSMSPAPPKRPQHLLPGIPGQQKPVAPSGNMAGMPSSTVPYPAGSAPQAAQTSRVTEVFDASPSDTTSPNYIRNELQSHPQETMMRIMGDTNARMTPNVDLAEVVAATSATMSTDQRNRMVSSMSRRIATPSNEPSTSPFQPPAMPSTTSVPPAPSSPPASAPAHPIASLSPILNAPKPPSVQEVSQPLIGIHELERAQRDVDKEIQHLGQTVASLSPTGHIPGYEGTSSDFDFNQYLDLDGSYNNSNYGFDFNDLNNTAGNFGGADGNDFDFSLPDTNLPPASATTDGAAVPAIDGLYPNGTATAEDTPSPAVTEEIQRTDLDGADQPSAKRRRQE